MLGETRLRATTRPATRPAARVSTLRARFLLGAALLASAFILTAVGGGLALQTMRIGSPAYNAILRDKDLVADILPPPVYVVEAALEVSHAFQNPNGLPTYRPRIAALHRDYDAQQAAWAASDAPEPLKAALAGPVAETADAFWNATEVRLLPALQRGDQGMALEAFADAETAFAAHKLAVSQLVTLAKAQENRDEAQARGLTGVVFAGLASAALVVLGLIFAASLYLMRGVFAPLEILADVTARIAAGDETATIPGETRKDELGALARALAVFKSNTVGLIDARAQIEAAKRNQGVIEFDMTGRILDANENFTKVIGYELSDLRGRSHRELVDPAYAASPDYAEFWRRLQAGEFIAGKFERVGKGGKRVIIDAVYNAIPGPDGRPFKVVKFATDVTAAEIARERSEAAQKVVVDETAKGLSALASGDLGHRIETDFSGEYAKLRSDFNAAMGSLEETMGVITSNAQAMQTGAGEISQAADDLSRRTEQQAATLEETAAALDEITATVRRTAEGAQRATVVVTDARQDAETSGLVVSKAVSAMGEIERSADQISQIIGVIDEIAFQTNLLALNAGVEAARAGDAGRGFAVVASEVRALAQRSAEAAKEIKALISASTGQVKEGVTLVGQTGQALGAIVGRVSEINNLMAEINASAQEQATALGQVNTAVNQMDQTTQQNAAMVEQSTAASHNLNQEAAELVRLVGQFKLTSEPQGKAAASRSARRPAVVHQLPTPRPKPLTASFRQSQGALAVKDDVEWEEF